MCALLRLPPPLAQSPSSFFIFFDWKIVFFFFFDYVVALPFPAIYRYHPPLPSSLPLRAALIACCSIRAQICSRGACQNSPPILPSLYSLERSGKRRKWQTDDAAGLAPEKKTHFESSLLSVPRFSEEEGGGMSKCQTVPIAYCLFCQPTDAHAQVFLLIVVGCLRPPLFSFRPL